MHSPCSKPSPGIVWSERITLHNILHMERFAVKPLTLQSIGDHDVLLDITHDLLKSKG